MEIPHLVRERLGDESVETAVNLGDEDLVCVTPTRTLVYRAEGLLSDESVSAYPHDVEQFDVSVGRRKTEFVFRYVDGTESFTVSKDRAETILELLLGGILRVADVTVDGESVSDVFSFSELTLIVTSHRLVKHVGAPVWDADFEEYPYADVTGLSFEEGSVATQVVLSVDGRPNRIKAPSEEAPKVERALTRALFAYHDVDSLAELNEAVGVKTDTPPDGRDDHSGGLSLDEGIAPLVGGDDEDSRSADRESRDSGTSRAQSAAEPGSEAGSGDASVDTVSTSPASASRDESEGGDRGGSAAEQRDTSVDPEEIEAMKRRLSTLTTAVKKQNELLRNQHETIEQLVEELRRGR